MTRAATTALLIALCGCATPQPAPLKLDTDERRVVWIRDAATAIRSCGVDANGCHKLREGVHYIYTRAPRGPDDQALHCTAGHELRHVFEGQFHDVQTPVLYLKHWRY